MGSLALLITVTLLASCAPSAATPAPSKGAETPAGAAPNAKANAPAKSLTTIEVQQSFVPDSLWVYVNAAIDKGFFKDEWRLERTAAPAEGSAPGQRALFAGLFKAGSPLVLKNTNASTVSGARRAHSKAIGDLLEPRP